MMAHLMDSGTFKWSITRLKGCYDIFKDNTIARDFEYTLWANYAIDVCITEEIMKEWCLLNLKGRFYIFSGINPYPKVQP